MTRLDLRVLIDRPTRLQREQQRGARRRREAGQKIRSIYEVPAKARRQTVARLRASGLTWRKIGTQLGISESEARRLAKSMSLEITSPACAGSVPVYGGVARAMPPIEAGARSDVASHSLDPAVACLHPHLAKAAIADCTCKHTLG